MNLNDYPEELKIEEQRVLGDLVLQMDQVINSLSERLREFVSEAKNTDISVNPDEYISLLLTQKGIRDTEENREKLLRARDELYHTRLFVQCEDSEGITFDEMKIGLHSSTYHNNLFVLDWRMPVCRHYLLDNSSVEYESVVKRQPGEEYHTKYKLLVRNKVELRFTRVVKATNMFPGIVDNDTLEMIKGSGFFCDAFLDSMIEQFNPDDFNPDAIAAVIYDEFLNELVERRSTPEFKNIVFSIQKKQGEIIQAPYEKNMIVQGCAGSGKSMIMLHRLPILLYDNPDALRRNSLYVITPSQMYVQLAESMRYQLEISDIEMGTLEQYYDYCIEKYVGHKAGEYGKISYRAKITAENEKYIYSQKCIEDIKAFYEFIGKSEVSLEKAFSVLSIVDDEKRVLGSYAQSNRSILLKLQKIINANNDVLSKYFKGIKDVLDALYTLSSTLVYRKEEVIRNIKKEISKYEDEKSKAQKELVKLNTEDNAVAVQNRLNIVGAAENRIEQLNENVTDIEKDDEYFESLLKINSKLETVLEPFDELKNNFSQNSIEKIYDVINSAGQLIGGFFMISWEISKLNDKYIDYVAPFSRDVEKAGHCVSVLQATNENYIDQDYYTKVVEEHDRLSRLGANAIKEAYELIMGNVGIKRTDKGNIRAIKCSPYLYLQSIYCYQGAPSSNDSLLAIDEVQSIAPEEIRLLYNVNGGKAVFNMFGDIYQHIEGTKGVDSWDEYRNIFDYDKYEMLENYRNASQITEYCNKSFGMSMNPINTLGKGVHEYNAIEEFKSEIEKQLVNDNRTGLAAILVGDDTEVSAIYRLFALYKDKFHDMTKEEFSVHRTRWNIMNISDAKGLEFSTVIVLSGRMSRNEKYIAYTRALDELFIFSGLLETDGNEMKSSNDSESMTTEHLLTSELQEVTALEIQKNITKHSDEKKATDYSNSEVRSFLEENGMKVVDNRDAGGKLWVVGEKEAIRTVINQTISKFKISGKYASSKEINNKNGWYTKTDK